MCILGTGSNAAFVERIENYNKFEGKDPDTKQVCNQNFKKRVDQSLFNYHAAPTGDPVCVFV